MKKLYIPIKYKFAFCFLFSLLFSIVCCFISYNWYLDLKDIVGWFMSAFIIGGIAIVPGFLNTFLITSTLIDRQKHNHDVDPKDDIYIILAAYNEGSKLYNTLRYISNQDYSGKITVLVADNNSNDNTYTEVLRAREELDVNVEYIFDPKQGKHFALNSALNLVKSKYVITLDADTILHKKAVRYLVDRISKDGVVAVAGAIMAKNGRGPLIAKMQEWDYFLSMSAIKKMQGMYQGTLVAQGAFSIYDTQKVREAGGWPDCIGEDIVLTWNLLKNGDLVYYEPLAIAFTEVPETLKHFIKQRSRWARGMIEGLRNVKPWQFKTFYYKFLTFIDIAIIYMDFSYTFFFIPGIVLFLFGIDIIVGKMFLFVLPLTLITFLIIYTTQKRRVFDVLELKVRHNFLGFLAFILFYQFIMSPVSIYGYVQEFLGKDRVWK